jgi:hypothetical protein
MALRRIGIVLSLLVVALFLSLANASGQAPIFATIAGPPGLAPGQVATYDLSFVGGPTGQVDYSVTYHLTGPNPAGAVPDPSTPTTLTGNTTSFKLNVTAPATEQTITLVVRIAARSGSIFENTTVERSIVVITPILLTATFRNQASTAAFNVTVRFYVDGTSLGTKVIARIDANGLGTASFDYLPVGLQAGSHSVRVEADLDGNGIVDPARGEVVFSELFYKGTSSLSTGWTILIGIGVFVPVFLVTAGLRRRGRR